MPVKWCENYCKTTKSHQQRSTNKPLWKYGIIVHNIFN